MRPVFLDTSYVIALAAPADRLHPKAKALADRLRRDRLGVLTTRAVLLEIGNALSRLKQREVAARFLVSLERDPQVEIISLSDDLYLRGLDLFRRRADKSWGLVDCISFEVMKTRAVTDSLTADTHFEQAGFRALLR